MQQEKPQPMKAPAKVWAQLCQRPFLWILVAIVRGTSL